jgi:hypothetical protein
MIDLYVDKPAFDHEIVSRNFKIKFRWKPCGVGKFDSGSRFREIDNGARQSLTVIQDNHCRFKY